MFVADIFVADMFAVDKFVANTFVADKSVADMFVADFLWPGSSGRRFARHGSIHAIHEQFEGIVLLATLQHIKRLSKSKIAHDIEGIKLNQRLALTDWPSISIILRLEAAHACFNAFRFLLAQPLSHQLAIESTPHFRQPRRGSTGGPHGPYLHDLAHLPPNYGWNLLSYSRTKVGLGVF